MAHRQYFSLRNVEPSKCRDFDTLRYSSILPAVKTSRQPQITICCASAKPNTEMILHSLPAICRVTSDGCSQNRIGLFINGDGMMKRARRTPSIYCHQCCHELWLSRKTFALCTCLNNKHLSCQNASPLRISYVSVIDSTALSYSFTYS
jgi:hypothetical protein